MTITDMTPLNGVDTGTLFATLDAVREHPELARFQFRSRTEWVDGTHNRSTVHGFYGAGAEQSHQQPYTAVADHPAVLVGQDRGPTPAEVVLQALGSCLMSGLANIAAARGIRLGAVTATVEGDINLLGILGLDPEVRNGYEEVRVTFHVDGDADAHALTALVEQARRRSAVYDVVTNGVPVSVAIAAA